MCYQLPLLPCLLTVTSHQSPVTSHLFPDNNREVSFFQELG
ncbi:MAG: hypothetical protein ACKO9I_19080 [Sphaerospermopsis kisseleviana]